MVPIVSSPYGERVHPVTGERTFHHGMDLRVPVGTPLAATHSGRIERVQRSHQYNGNAVFLAAEDGLTWAYLHMDNITVSPGQAVRAGQVIGTSGATGRVTGPHLHLEVRDRSGRSLNPESLFPPGYFRHG